MVVGAAFLAAGPAEAGARAGRWTSDRTSSLPARKTVKAGDKVRFVWEAGGGFEVHDVNVRKGPAKFKSPLQAGGSFTTEKLTKPGEVPPLLLAASGGDDDDAGRQGKKR